MKDKTTLKVRTGLLISHTVTLSPVLRAMIAMVGPPTYPAPMQQIEPLKSAIGLRLEAGPLSGVTFGRRKRDPTRWDPVGTHPFFRVGVLMWR